MIRSRRWYLITGGLLVGAVLCVALFADFLTGVSPYYMDSKPNIMQGTPPFPPEPGHPLGTDQFGRDIWSRIAYGARWSLLFAFLVMVGRLTIAIPMAVAAAFGPRPINWLVGRLYVYTSAVPPLLLYMLVLMAVNREIGLWPNVALTVTLLTLVEWPRLAIVLKGRLEELTGEQFIEGAIATGAAPWRIFWSHLMPHLWPTLLQLVVGEMGRGLLIIAQLGLFGVWVGGGILERFEDARGRPYLQPVAGVPEWGTMISGTRTFIYTAPWIPIAPAFAFFIGVVGFNLLSQGLEGITVSLGRWKEATTGRLSPRWRFAWVVVPLVAAAWYYQGLPADREKEITALAERQGAALTARSAAAYLQTLAPDLDSYANEQRRWAESFVTSDYTVAAVKPTKIQVTGNTATAEWTLVVGYKHRAPLSVRREVRLVRRLGTWYEVGDDLKTIRGFHVDVQARYDPTAPGAEAIDQRWAVHYIGTTADHAFRKVDPLFPPMAGERPLIRMYPSHQAFLAAIAAEPAAQLANPTIWYTPGQAIRISPELLRVINRREHERMLAYELTKYMADSRLHSLQSLPIFMGAYELAVDDNEVYRFEFDHMAHSPLFTLQQMFTVGPNDLPQDRQRVYASQAALLMEFVSKGASPEEVFAAVKDSRDVLASLAKFKGVSVQQLAADYDAHVMQRIDARSVLHLPAGRARIPLALTDAIQARADAAAAGDEGAFLPWAAEANRESHRQWLSAARQAGLQSYSAKVLEMENKSGTFRVYVLERLTFANGEVKAGIVIQDWVERSSGWQTGAVVSPYKPAGR